jgi:hypothetical protein
LIDLAEHYERCLDQGRTTEHSPTGLKPSQNAKLFLPFQSHPISQPPIVRSLPDL